MDEDISKCLNCTRPRCNNCLAYVPKEGRRRVGKGGVYKYDDDYVRMIGAAYEAGETIVQLSRRLQIPSSTVGHLLYRFRGLEAAGYGKITK